MPDSAGCLKILIDRTVASCQAWGISKRESCHVLALSLFIFAICISSSNRRTSVKDPLAKILTTAVGVLCISVSVDARSIVQVDVYGTVIFNGTSGSPLVSVTVGQTARTSFTLDSSIFVDSIPGTVRAYTITPGSFSLSFSGGASVGATGPAFFGVRNNDPAVDGFFVSDNTTNLGGVALTQAPYREDFHATYGGSTLSSVDILAATGTYNFTGLTVFGYNLWQAFPDNVRMDINYDHMTIAVVPAPAGILALAPLGLGRRRRPGPALRFGPA